MDTEPDLKLVRTLRRFALLAALGLFCMGHAVAGPVIIDGTDANDHGFVSGGVNQNGWLYMQKALENLASELDPSVSKTLVVYGNNTSTAANAINSAFNLSTLPADGWTIQHVAGTTDIANHLASLSTSNTGILFLGTRGTAAGDMSLAELEVVNANATAIANFVAGDGDPELGGGFWAMSQLGTTAVPEFGWLTALIPGLVANQVGGGGIGTALSLTPEGHAAFPGLTNADLSAGPWHAYFSGDFGGLSVLATANCSSSFVCGSDFNTQVPVIIGGGAGTVFVPDPGRVPEPGTLLLVAAGLLGVAVRRRYSK